MSTKTFLSLLYALVVLAILSGCATAPVAAEQAPATTTPPPPATATEVPPTVVMDTPTAVVTEFVASRMEQMLGSWKQGSPQGYIFIILFQADSTYEITRGDVPNVGRPYQAKFWFDGGVLYVEGKCGDDNSVQQGKYEAPVIVQRNGMNHKLTAQVIEDPCKDRVSDFRKGYVWMDPQP